MNLFFVLAHVKRVLFLVLFFATSISASAQRIIIINPVFFHADSAKKLLLINAPLQQLRAAVQGRDSITGLVASGRQYTFVRPVAKLSTRTSYRAASQGTTYTVCFTQVPVLALSTRYQVVDTPSVYARLMLTDTTGITAQSATGIEIRGDYSQSYPKKSFELSLWADTLGAASRELALLGLRQDNKWNLQAMYNDQLRVRLKVANELWQDIHQLYYKAQEPSAKSGIALAYTEVFINGSYQGIYTLTERIDRKQLKLKKYAQGIKGELYKGDNWGAATKFSSAPPFNNNSLTWGGFAYKEPSEVTDWANLSDFVSFVTTSSDGNFYSQYQSRFNLANAVDYYLFLNLVRATDNTAKNNYIAKYKANEPYYYVPWDLDGVLGNDWSGANVNITNDILSNGFYDRLVKDYSATGFQAALSRRWSSLRTSVVTEAGIGARISTNHAYLLQNNVYEREQLAWPDYQYDAGQVAYPGTWLKDRLAYLDAAFGPAAVLSAAGATDIALRVYPNPTSEYVYIETKSVPYQLSIQDVHGKTVLQTVLTSSVSRVAVGSLPKGLYLASLKTPATTVVKKLLIQ
ncbi:MAG: T9SS type A sorting domain-containing protein [Hymenobacter sp.]|nr:MAG: T9SS type A sorting domain-containing protein [Hymenobacter sp.]